MAKRRTSVIQVMITGDARELQKATGVANNALGLLITTAAQVASALTSALAAGVIAATRYESAFAGVTKTVDGTAAELAALSDGIREMSRRLPASSIEIAAVAEAAGQLGIQQDAILGFSEVMINLGETTNLSATDAATQLARLASITQMPQDEFDRLGSVVVALGNNFETTEAEIVDMSLGLAGAAEVVGLSEDQMLALATAMSSLGIESEAGGSSASRVLLAHQDAVFAGGQELARFADIAGTSSQEFRKAFETDAASAFVMFIDGLQGIRAAGGDVSAALESVGFSDVRVTRALLSMTTSGSKLTDALNVASDAWRENTALSEEAQKRYDTFAAQLQIVRNNFTDLAIELGNVLLPYLKQLSAWFITNRDRIRESLQGIITKFEELVSRIVTKGGEWKQTFETQYAPGLLLIWSAINEKLLPAIGEFVSVIASTLVPSADGATGSFDKFAEGIAGVITVISDKLVPIAEDVLVPIIEGMRDAFSALLDVVTENPEAFDALVAGLKAFIGPLALLAQPEIAEAVGTAIRIAGEALAGVLEGVLKLEEKFPGFLMGLANLYLAFKVLTGAVAVFNLVAAMNPYIIIIAAIIVAIGLLIYYWDDLKLNAEILGTTISVAWEKIKAAVIGAVLAAFLYVTQNNPIARMWDKIKELWPDIKLWFEELPDRVIEEVTSLIDRMKTFGKDIIDGMKQGVLDEAERLKEAVTDTIGGAIDSARELLRIDSPSLVFEQMGQQTVEGYVQGLDSMKGLSNNAMAGVLDFQPNAQGSGSGGGSTINVTVTSADPQAVVEALRRYVRHNGPLGQVVTV